MKRFTTLLALSLAIGFAVPGYTAGGTKDLRNEAVGMYTDTSVAAQVSSFSINRLMVSCGVGTLAASGQLSGPFVMLMYAKEIRTFVVNHAAGTITATGKMRSITRIGPETMEDVVHNFIAIAAKGATPADDRFDVNFMTPFWNQASNKMCTASSLVPGGCRFGGKLILGQIAV